jgi:hypothetical protein
MVAAITPTLGKRHDFMQLCREYVRRQTVKCEHIVVDEPQTIFPTDLTYRYKAAIEKAKAKGCTVAVVFEDDDWYHPEYVERLLNFWEQSGKPEVVGISDSHYYHIGTNQYWHSVHAGRSSMCAMLLRLDVEFKFPVESEIWLDIHLCKAHQGAYFVPPFPLVVGIKHGIGQCGGVGHRKNFSQYKADPNWLKNNIGNDFEKYIPLARKSQLLCR